MKYILLALSLVVYLLLLYVRIDSVCCKFDVGQKVKVSGIVSEEPTLYGDKQQIKLATISVYLPRFPEYHYGDNLAVTGLVEMGKYSYYLQDPQVLETPRNDKTIVSKILLNFRQHTLEIFGKSLPPLEGGLLKGLILSTKNSLDSDFYQSLKTTGTLHVVVASGTNVSLLAGAVVPVIALYTKRRQAILVGLFVVWCYVFLIGGQPPIIRAAIFITSVSVGQLFGRETSVWRILLITAALMLLINPYWVMDLGFQLSFAATMGILLFSKFFERNLKKIHVLPGLFRSDLSTTLAAQIFVTPLLMMTFGQVSVISPIVNMLVLWVVPFVTLGGMVMALVSLISEPLAQGMAWILYVPLWYFTQTVELFSRIG